MLVRAAVPAPSRPRSLRNGRVGFRPCRRRVNCALCKHNPGPTSAFSCPVTGTEIEISQTITCTDVGVYLILCKKDTGRCATLHPCYVGETGEGFGSSFAHRLASHLGTATNQSQVDTDKPVGRHFRLGGHDDHRDLVMLPIEKIEDTFTRKAREAYLIKKFKTLKRLAVTEIEHGLNLSRVYFGRLSSFE